MTQSTGKIMYKLKRHGKTIQLAPLAVCFQTLKDKVGFAPAHELQQAGWSIDPARPTKKAA